MARVFLFYPCNSAFVLFNMRQADSVPARKKHWKEVTGRETGRKKRDHVGRKWGFLDCEESEIKITAFEVKTIEKTEKSTDLKV